MVSQGGHTKFIPNDPRLIGNKYGVGNVSGKSGRVRTVTPEKEELIALGEDLIEWAAFKTKKDEIRSRYCQWYTEKGFTGLQWQQMKDKPEFRWYYERAQCLLGNKYVDGTVNPSIAHRFLRVYCPEVKVEENEEIVFKANTASQAIQSYTQEDSDKLSLVLNAINQRQTEASSSPKPSLSEAESKSSTEIKS